MDGDFTAANLPLGVAWRDEWTDPHVVVAIGDQAVDCVLAHAAGAFRGLDLDPTDFVSGSLNRLLAGGNEVIRAVREQVRDRLDDAALLVDRGELTMLLPIEVADFVDFYSSEHHARNLGQILRPGEPPLQPNWRHLPVSYHGRAGTVVVSGTDVTRPRGMVDAGGDAPRYLPTSKLDVEVELGAVIGVASSAGEVIEAGVASDRVAGFVLLNDWSARDIQSFEFRPLGPHQAKSFATSISPWLVTLDALEPFRVAGPTQEPPPAAHLSSSEPHAYDMQLELSLRTAAMRDAGRPPEVVAESNAAAMYWNVAQQVAHVTANGARLRTGDLIGSGTISGPGPADVGSLVELTRDGAEPMVLPGGERRGFLEDGDEVTIRGWAGSGDALVDLGHVVATVVPAVD